MTTSSKLWVGLIVRMAVLGVFGYVLVQAHQADLRQQARLETALKERDEARAQAVTLANIAGIQGQIIRRMRAGCEQLEKSL